MRLHPPTEGANGCSAWRAADAFGAAATLGASLLPRIAHSCPKPTRVSLSSPMRAAQLRLPDAVRHAPRGITRTAPAYPSLGVGYVVA